MPKKAKVNAKTQKNSAAARHDAAPEQDFKNNVTRLLDAKRVDYQVHTYSLATLSNAHASTHKTDTNKTYTDESGTGIALDVARAIGLPGERVFKTLVVLPDSVSGPSASSPGPKAMLVLIPAPETLNLKALARAAGLKKAKMATQQQAEQLTGLQTGGISPLALTTRPFRVYIDERAQDYATIAVSAGERGANIELSVADLIRVTKAKPVSLQG